MSDDTPESPHRHDAELRLLLNQLPVVLWAVDLDLRFTFSEGRGLHSIGLQPGQVIGMSLRDFFQMDEADNETIQRHLQATRGEISEFEMQWLERDFQCRIEPWRNEAGAIIGCWGCALDVTERRRAERAEEQSELQRQAIAENVPAFILLIDAAARIHYINRVQPGRRPEDVLASTVYDFLPFQQATVFSANLTRLFAEQTPFHYESTVESPDGQWRTYHSRVIPFPTNGGPARALLIATDITETRHAENIIAAQQAKLLHVARLSTMGQMVAAFSHEVTQPLAAISNFAAACLLLLQQLPSADPRLTKHLNSIAEQATRAGSIIAGMRQLAKRGQVAQVEADLTDVVTSAIRLITGEMRSRHIALRVDLPSSPLRVSVDAVQIQQVLINIIQNACDAIESLPGAIREIQVRCAAEGGRAVIEVADRGPGFTSGVVENLFAPFFTTKADGMGLGLSICRDIVTAHQGTLDARNQVDGGACFRISLPILDDFSAARCCR